jgi:hypothetical protein
VVSISGVGDAVYLPHQMPSELRLLELFIWNHFDVFITLSTFKCSHPTPHFHLHPLALTFLTSFTSAGVLDEASRFLIYSQTNALSIRYLERMWKFEVSCHESIAICHAHNAPKPVESVDAFLLRLA